jgi:hypothetical protein
MIGTFIEVETKKGFYNIVDVFLSDGNTAYLYVDEKGKTGSCFPTDVTRIVDKEEADEYIKANTVGYLVGVMNQKNFIPKTEIMELEKALEYKPEINERLAEGTAWVIMKVNGKNERKVTHYYAKNLASRESNWVEYKE